MTVTKFFPLKAGQRGNCPDRQCTTPGWCSLLETSVRKLHIYNFSGPDICMWCSMQPSLCSQKGLCWKLSWKWSHGGLWFDVYSPTWVCLTPPEGNDFLSARDVFRSSSPHCVEGVAWGRCEGCRPQLCSASCTQDTAAECTIPLHVCLGELRLWTLPVQPAQFLWGKIGCVCVSTLNSWDIKKLLNFWPLGL